MEREAEILALYLALRESIDQRISELKALRALCAPGKSGQGSNRGNAATDGAWANWSPEQREKSNASGAWTVAKRKLAAAQQAGDSVAISAAFDGVERALVRLNAAKAARDAAKGSVAVLAEIIIGQTREIPAASNEPIGAVESFVPVVCSNTMGGPENPAVEGSPLTVISADIAAAFGLENLPGAVIVQTIGERFAAPFNDSASVPPKASKPRKAKSASVSIPAAGRLKNTARKGQKASV